jgi:hypothetical protein
MANKAKRKIKITGISKTGYRAVWDMGRAANAKKIWKLSKPNRPGI